MLGLDQQGRRAWSSTTPTATTPDYPLKEWDLITKIGDHEIDNAGMVQVNDDLRLPVPVPGPEARQGRQGPADGRPRGQGR